MKRWLLVPWLLSGLLTAAAAVPPAEAGVLRFAKTFAPGTKDFIAVRNAAAKVESRTDRRVQVEWIEVDLRTDLAGELRSGKVDLVALPTAALAEEVPGVLPFALPGVFRSTEELERVQDALGEDVDQRLRAHGLVTLAHVQRGFTYLLSVGPITTPDELAAARLWLPEGDGFEALEQSIAAHAVRLPFGEVGKSLQRAREGAKDAVNAVIAWPAMAILQGWNAYVTDALLVPMFPMDLRLVVRAEAWDALAPSDRDVLREEMQRAFADIARTSAATDRDWQRVLERFGVRFHRPEGEALHAWWRWGEELSARALEGRDEDQRVLDQVRAAVAEMRK